MAGKGGKQGRLTRAVNSKRRAPPEAKTPSTAKVKASGRVRIASPAPFLVGEDEGLSRRPGGVLQAASGRSRSTRGWRWCWSSTCRRRTRATFHRFWEARRRFPIHQATDAINIEPSHIYVIQADARMAVVDGPVSKSGHRPTNRSQIHPHQSISSSRWRAAIGNTPSP